LSLEARTLSVGGKNEHPGEKPLDEFIKNKTGRRSIHRLPVLSGQLPFEN
jgi:hypothetical protein